MRPEELMDIIDNTNFDGEPCQYFYEAMGGKEKQVVLPVCGGEIVFHSFSKHGSGAWYFNDTAD